jgi:hypothetical protein
MFLLFLAYRPLSCHFSSYLCPKITFFLKVYQGKLLWVFFIMRVLMFIISYCIIRSVVNYKSGT